MNSRIKELRKALGLTLENFGNRLGVTKTAISKIEKGERSLTERMILSIVRTDWNGKHVNESWLRTGEGKMFVDFLENDEIATLVYQLLGPERNIFHEQIINIMRTYNELTPASKDIIDDFIDKLYTAGKAKEKTEDLAQPVQGGGSLTAGEFKKIFDSIPDTPEEIEKMYPPVNIDEIKKGNNVG